VLKGTDIEFRVSATGVAPPLTVNLTTATWGGAAAGQGSSKRITFRNPAAANMPANGVTVSVAFGGQTVAVTVIVFALTTTAQIADNFVGRSTTDLGVDERVQLGFATTPVGVSAAEAGGLRWSFDANAAGDRNTVGLVHDPATNAAPLPAMQTGVVDYIAPCRTSPANTAPVPQRAVKLKLSIVNGVCAGLGPELSYVIRMPTAHMREQVGGARRHVQGQPSAGFKGEIFLTPKNVSFRTLGFREGAGAMVVSGAAPVAWAGLAHGTTPFTSTISGGNSGSGCTVVGIVDDVYSGAFVYAVPPRASPRNVVGTLSWPIDWEYTYPTLPPAPAGWATVWLKMQMAHHRARLYEDGAMEIFKGHEKCASSDCMSVPIRKDVNDPNVA
ncbi:MAG TPA: hypothetical protein VJ890_11490, partial [Vineibacter sp.]|nr:hypothetical protein [Vineibacter sp.]